MIAKASMARIAVTCALAWLSGSAGASSGGSEVEISGPVEGGDRGFPYSASIVDLEPYGYREQEYFVSGSAHSFAADGALSADGRWDVKPTKDIDYKTRILVRKPAPEKFNGTIVVEYMQAYFGSERDTNFRWVAETLLREGYGWVGVSLFHEAIDDDTPPQTFTYGGVTLTTGMNLSRWDAERYGSLTVPSTDLSYDILSQVGRAVGPERQVEGVDPFAGYNVEHVLAVGNTIAAKRLGVYINAVQPQSQAFDGFYLQDWSPDEVGLSEGGPVPTGYRLRSDLEAPVLVLNTTTAVVQMPEQPEGPMQRFWTPAGSSHTTGPYMMRVAKANERDMGQSGPGLCPPDYANNFPLRYIAGAAIVALDHWVKTGEPAPSFPQLQRVKQGDNWVTPFDEQGNSRGGLRSPWVDVPTRRYDWRGECMGGSGRSEALSPQQLEAVYGTPDVYHRRFQAAAQKAVEQGILLEEDAKKAVEAARSVTW